MNTSQSWSHFKHGVAKDEFKEQLKDLSENELRDLHKRMLRKRFAGKTSVVTGVTGALPTWGLSLVGSLVGSRRARINSDRIELIEEVLKEKGWKGHTMGLKDYALPVTLGAVGVGIGLDAAMHHVAEAAMVPPIDVSTSVDPSMMSAGAGIVPPVDPSVGMVDPTALSLPPMDPTIGTGYDPTMIDQSGLLAADPSAGMGYTSVPYDPSMVAQPNIVAPPTIDGLQTPFNDMTISGYDPSLGADTMGTGLQTGDTDPFNIFGPDPVMSGQYPPPGNLMGYQPFGVNAIASAGAAGVVTTATHATPLLHHAAHKGAEMIGKKGIGKAYYKIVDHEKPADGGTALPGEVATPKYQSPQFVGVDRSATSLGNWGETATCAKPADSGATLAGEAATARYLSAQLVGENRSALSFNDLGDNMSNTPLDLHSTVVPTPIASSDVQIHEKNTSKNPFRIAARSANRRVPAKGPPGSPDSVLHAIAVSTFYGQEDGDLSFREGDTIDILERTNHGKDWWLGRKGSTVGTFLSDTVQILDTAIAKYSFDSRGEDELAFGEGDIIEVVARTEHRDEWWIGRKGTIMGVFPANYVEDLC
jgi:hypothetical protein